MVYFGQFIGEVWYGKCLSFRQCCRSGMFYSGSEHFSSWIPDPDPKMFCFHPGSRSDLKWKVGCKLTFFLLRLSHSQKDSRSDIRKNASRNWIPADPGGSGSATLLLGKVGDPDSVTLLIRIRMGIWIPDPGARKLRNFSGKMHFLVILKNFH
jgi:hypothetical protein